MPHQNPAAPPLRRLDGLFFRAVTIDRMEHVLAPPSPASAGRYHRPGQPALYMSPTAEWATIAVSGYLREDGRPRVVIPLHVENAFVIDQHDEQACISLGVDRDVSNVSWRPALAAGTEPASWRNADRARTIGADGLIDRSRKISGGWHVTLFRWNVLGGPTVQVCGEPLPIALSRNGTKWSL